MDKSNPSNHTYRNVRVLVIEGKVILSFLSLFLTFFFVNNLDGTREREIIVLIWNCI